MAHLVGEIRRFAGGRLPVGWAACDGALLPIVEHQPLFSLLGWRFGGDGWTTFCLPALRSSVAALDYGIAEGGGYPTRDGTMFGDAYVGEVRLFSGGYAPPGWVACDGRTLPVAEPYLELYGVVGNTWGGDGEHFVLPSLPAEQPHASGSAGQLIYIIAVAGELPVRRWAE